MVFCTLLAFHEDTFLKNTFTEGKIKASTRPRTLRFKVTLNTERPGFLLVTNEPECNEAACLEDELT